MYQEIFWYLPIWKLITLIGKNSPNLKAWCCSIFYIISQEGRETGKKKKPKNNQSKGKKKQNKTNNPTKHQKAPKKLLLLRVVGRCELVKPAAALVSRASIERGLKPDCRQSFCTAAPRSAAICAPQSCNISLGSSSFSPPKAEHTAQEFLEVAACHLSGANPDLNSLNNSSSLCFSPELFVMTSFSSSLNSSPHQWQLLMNSDGSFPSLLCFFK